MFQFGKYIYFVERLPHESDEHYFIRNMFIAKNSPKDQKEYDILVIYSKILINYKYLNMDYNKKVINKLNEFVLV